MDDTTPSWVAMVLACVCFAAYFRYGLPVLDRLSHLLARHLPIWREQDWVSRSDAMHLVIAVLGQAMLLGLLMPLAGAGAVHLSWSLSSLVLGMLLGVGEMACSALLVNIVLNALSHFLGGQAPRSISGWVPYSRGGWMRYFFSVSRHAHWTMQLLLCVGYIAVEEILYRVMLIEIFRPLGGVVAIAGSVVWFIIAQMVWTPGWRTWLFPTISALVVGPVHGYLYWRQGEILPLIVAHLAFFVASTWQPHAAAAASPTSV